MSPRVNCACVCLCVRPKRKEEKQQDTGDRSFLLAACGDAQLTLYPSTLAPLGDTSTLSSSVAQTAKSVQRGEKMGLLFAREDVWLVD